MAASTIYDVRLMYMLEDRASGGLRNMDKRLKSTAASSGMLTSKLKGLAASAAGLFTIGAASKALVGYNRQVEDARTNIAGLVMTTTGASWDASIGAAASMMTDLQDRAAKSTATTAEMVAFMNDTVQPMLSAGLHAKDLADFTADAVIAAKAFGDEQIAALDIQQALNQGVMIKDRFTRKLLGTIKMEREEFNKLNKSQRLAVLQGAVSSPAIRKLGEEQSKTFSGVFSTFTDNMQRTMGLAGQGIFESVRGQLESWNDWLNSNEARVKDIGKTVGKHLVDGFKSIKSVVSFFVDHADTLILVAKAWAGLKLGSMAGGLFGGILGKGSLLQKAGGGLLARNFDKTGVRVASFGASMVNASSKVLKFMGPLGLAAGALKGIFDWWTAEDPTTKAKSNVAQETSRALISTQTAMAPLLEKRLKTLGATALSPFGPRAPGEEDDVSTGKFFQFFRNASMSPTPVSDLTSGTFTGSGELSEKQRISMEMNAESLRKHASGFEEATLSMAKWAMENDLFTDDLKGIRLDLIKNKEHAEEQLNLNEEARRDVSIGLHLLDRQIRNGLSISDLLGGGDSAFSKIPDVAMPEDSKPPKVNVTIQRIEVKSEDPDRFVFSLQSAVSKLANNPSQSAFAQRLGGR